jgi:5'-phosphate synthase pdxT subunit
MRIGVLALQGAVQDHGPPLRRLGAELVEVRHAEDLDNLDGLILPGGESTVMGRYLREYALIEPIRALASSGMPIWGLCAGAIILCTKVDGHEGVLGLITAQAERNAYGRQLSSFEEEIDMEDGPFYGVFIRAPRLSPLDGTEVIGRRRSASGAIGEAVFLRKGNILAASFHPELTGDDRLHERFLSLAAKRRETTAQHWSSSG